MNAIPIFPGIAVLLIGAVLLVVMILLLTHSRSRPVGVAVLIALGLGLAALFFVAVPRRVVREIHDRPAAALVETLPVIWSEGMERQFQADIYPSRESAAFGLGRAAGKWILARRHSESPILLHSPDGNLSADLLIPVRLGLLDAAADLAITTSYRDTSGAAAPDVTALDLAVDEPGRTAAVTDESPASRSPLQGELRVTLSVSGQQAHRIKTLFRDVPWLVNTAAYMNEPGHQEHVVVYSLESCTSADEARRQAMQRAQKAVQARLFPGRPGRAPVAAEDLRQAGLVLDRFTQSLDGTAGKIWREALLLDTSPAKIAALRETKRTVIRAQQKTYASLLGSALGLGLIIFILYIFLNAATRGYYTWALRIVAVVVMGAISAVILMTHVL
jgi:hypothetical protein